MSLSFWEVRGTNTDSSAAAQALLPDQHKMCLSKLRPVDEQWYGLPVNPANTVQRFTDPSPLFTPGAPGSSVLSKRTEELASAVAFLLRVVEDPTWEIAFREKFTVDYVAYLAGPNDVAGELKLPTISWHVGSHRWQVSEILDDKNGPWAKSYCRGGASVVQVTVDRTDVIESTPSAGLCVWVYARATTQAGRDYVTIDGVESAYDMVALSMSKVREVRELWSMAQAILDIRSVRAQVSWKVGVTTNSVYFVPSRVNMLHNSTASNIAGASKFDESSGVAKFKSLKESDMYKLFQHPLHPFVTSVKTAQLCAQQSEAALANDESFVAVTHARFDPAAANDAGVTSTEAACHISDLRPADTLFLAKEGKDVTGSIEVVYVRDTNDYFYYVAKRGGLVAKYIESFDVCRPPIKLLDNTLRASLDSDTLGTVCTVAPDNTLRVYHTFFYQALRQRIQDNVITQVVYVQDVAAVLQSIDDVAKIFSCTFNIGDRGAVAWHHLGFSGTIYFVRNSANLHLAEQLGATDYASPWYGTSNLDFYAEYDVVCGAFARFLISDALTSHGRCVDLTKMSFSEAAVRDGVVVLDDVKIDDLATVDGGIDVVLDVDYINTGRDYVLPTGVSMAIYDQNTLLAVSSVSWPEDTIAELHETLKARCEPWLKLSSQRKKEETERIRLNNVGPGDEVANAKLTWANWIAYKKSQAANAHSQRVDVCGVLAMLRIIMSSPSKRKVCWWSRGASNDYRIIQDVKPYTCEVRLKRNASSSIPHSKLLWNDLSTVSPTFNALCERHGWTVPHTSFYEVLMFGWRLRLDDSKFDPRRTPKPMTIYRTLPWLEAVVNDWKLNFGHCLAVVGVDLRTIPEIEVEESPLTSTDDNEGLFLSGERTKDLKEATLLLTETSSRARWDYPETVLPGVLGSDVSSSSSSTASGHVE